MKKISFMLCILPLLLGCAPQPTLFPTPKMEANLPPEFEAEFDRLFLSQEPLRYQDNEQFLESIQGLDLNTQERERVSEKLFQFLITEPKPRPYAPDSIHTGVASEIAFLRMQAIQLLAEIGTVEDAEFIRNLKASRDEHPLFNEECQKAIEKLESKR